jgi:hypothetical protein
MGKTDPDNADRHGTNLEDESERDLHLCAEVVPAGLRVFDASSE